MNEIPMRDTGDVDGLGDPIMRRVMTAAEILERAELNIANTASAQRRRVLEELARRNGPNVRPRSQTDPST